MKVINFNQEWDFIIAETHNEKPNRENLIKREILFALQLILDKIQMSAIGTKEIAMKKIFSEENYYALKAIYCSEKLKNKDFLE